MLVASHYLMAFTYYSVVSDFFVSSLYLHPKGEQIAYLHLLDTKGDEDSELQLTSFAKEKVLETMEINKQKRTVDPRSERGKVERSNDISHYWTNSTTKADFPYLHCLIKNCTPKLF